MDHIAALNAQARSMPDPEKVEPYVTRIIQERAII